MSISVIESVRQAIPTRLRPRAVLAQSGRRRPFATRVLLLSSGTLIGQAVLLLTGPVVARLYSPRDYGVLGMYASALSIATAVGMLRYDAAVAVADSDSDAANLVGLSLFIGSALAVLCGLGAGLARYLTSANQQLHMFGRCVWFLPVGMLLSCIYLSLSMWAVRKQYYGTLGKTKITQNIGMTTGQIAFRALGGGPAGLIAGHIIGQCGGMSSILRRIRTMDMSSMKLISFHGMRRAAWEFRRFPMFSTWAAGLNAAIEGTPVLFLATVFGPIPAGLYAFGQRVLYTPASLFCNSVGQVFLTELTALRRTEPERMAALFLRRVGVNSAIGAACGTVVAICAPKVIPLVLGNSWRDCATCIRILSPVLAMTFAANPFGCVLDVVFRQDLHLIREVLRGIFMTAACVSAKSHGGGWKQAVMLIAGAGVLNYFSYLGFSWFALRGYVRRGRTGPIQQQADSKC